MQEIQRKLGCKDRVGLGTDCALIARDAGKRGSFLLICTELHCSALIKLNSSHYIMDLTKFTKCANCVALVYTLVYTVYMYVLCGAFI